MDHVHPIHMLGGLFFLVQISAYSFSPWNTIILMAVNVWNPCTLRVKFSCIPIENSVPCTSLLKASKGLLRIAVCGGESAAIQPGALACVILIPLISIIQ